MDGGVAFSRTLHGRTGNGSAELPEFFAYAAAWGKAEMRLNGVLVADPTTGEREFSARVYVVRGQVRLAPDGAILNQGQSAPYKPVDPENAHVGPEGAQVIVELRTATKTLWHHYAFENAKVSLG